MAQFSSLSTLYFSCHQFQCPKLFNRKSCCSINSRSFSGSTCRTRFRGVVSSSARKLGGFSEVSDSESQPCYYAWPDKNKRPRVCILGGGFGGLYTALRLESLDWPDGKKPQVFLVDQSERFVFKPLLYELLSGEVEEWEIAPRFSELLSNTAVQFFKDRVQSIYPIDHMGMDGVSASASAGVVHLESGLLVEYDCYWRCLVALNCIFISMILNGWVGHLHLNDLLLVSYYLIWAARLVLAIGTEAKIDTTPGAMDYALPFSTLEDARRVNEKLTALERKCFAMETPIHVTVVGCGYTGLELAATISERLQARGVIQAINAGKIILPDAPPGNRESALKVLSSRNVQLLLGYFVCCIRKAGDFGGSCEPTKVEAVEDVVENHNNEKLALELQLAERGTRKQVVETDMVLWTVGSKSLLPQLELDDQTYLPLNGRGQAETDETLRVKGHPRIFALGDSSAVRNRKGKLLPDTAQVAFQQADFAGWNIWAAINGRPLLPFRYQNLGEMMTLGRYDAAVSPSFIEGLTLDGPVGHTARKLAYLLRLPTDEHRLKVGISWIAKSAVESAASLQNTLTKMLSGLK